MIRTHVKLGLVMSGILSLVGCADCSNEGGTERPPGGPGHDAGLILLDQPDAGTHEPADVDGGNATDATGFFESGQAADKMLAGQGFNETGGADLFNHPKGLASDGTRLIMCDGNNNRVLIWNSMPDNRTDSPDVVLGQPDFHQNDPGTGLEQMNWPVAVAVAEGGSPLIVADTYNNRLLVWTTFPTTNGQAADYAIQGLEVDATTILSAPTASVHDTARGNFVWPWGVWTDGTKLLVASTARSTYGNVHFGGWVMVWENFDFYDTALSGVVLPPSPPSGAAASNVWPSADYYLNAQGNMGTPRSITSNGTMILVGDHNASSVPTIPGAVTSMGNWVWETFPTQNDQTPDFFLADPSPNIWMNGCFTDNGELVLVGDTLHVWSTPPGTSGGVITHEAPDVSLRGQLIGLRGGDGSSVVCYDEKIYLADYNGNRILVFHDLPTHQEDFPDLAIGSPYSFNSLTGALNYSNSLDNNYFVTNPQIAFGGGSMFMASAFDGRLLGWKKTPVDITVPADLDVQEDMEGVSQLLVKDGLLFLVFGHGGVMDSSFRVWKDIDPDSTASDGFWNGGEPVTVTGSMGSADFGELVGSAIDDNYFYLNSKDGADYTLHIWERDSTDFYISDPDPAYSIALGSLGAGGHLFSDGEYLYVNSNSRVWYLPLATLSTTSTLTEIPDSDYWSSSVEQVASQNGHLFLSDKGYHRVLVWEDKGRAMAGEAPDVFLGATDEDDFGPNIGEKGLFWPSEMAFEANALWVGEYKFSGRAVRFSPKAP